jgi:tRNA uridine 5-carboxymethylaminomethyl modification enzyme
LGPGVLDQLEVEAIYGGYLKRQDADIRHLRASSTTCIPEGVDYSLVPGLNREARERLAQHRPGSIADLGAIEGITPASRMAVAAYVKQAVG